MSKTKTLYACQHCGSQYPQWQGQCRDCGKWNTLVEEESLTNKPSARVQGYAGTEAVLTLLKNVELQTESRLSTGLAEFDLVLGGGLVIGSVVLIGGDPGIGKSTILIQTICELAESIPVLYVTGEESPQQIAMRATRLQLSQEKVHLLAETHVERILQVAKKEKPKVMVIDSIQTVFSDLITSAPGSVIQVRESAAQLVRFAKQTGTTMLLVGHVTKEGSLAGPRVLEHMVDSVLYFEGQSDSRYRMIRAVKNRFGAANELGLFAMTEKGLKQVSNPSAIFLSKAEKPAAGSVVLTTWEGTRPLLVEVQALVDESHLANPRRVTVGLDHNRLAMLLAVLHRHAGVVTYDQDVFVNVVGGLKIVETAADLAIVVSVLSSLRDKIIPQDKIVFGEIGLAGEIRPVPYGAERLKEAVKHGFKTAIVPVGNAPKVALPGLEVKAVSRLCDVMNVF